MTVFITYLTLNTANKLSEFLDKPWPARHIDRDAHDLRMRALADLIYRDGGLSNESLTGFCCVKIGGVVTKSARGLQGATRLWINAVRNMAAAQVSA